ncbi:XRE family transcriptional regulator [Bacillus cereus]|uniref:helix-turn-helix domain-containing protein n=1 Tax=Bacillus cereus group TaxID=86661 RepID=UPI000B4BB14F|nr:MULTISPECIES: helix-turn-helix transcriptional regulator [Bacillus cereus group]HCX50715.1 XRE family transcriptional regulator [Bacillus sp. (in: firmicutes)]MDI6676984.1 helix-turn-helix transcriptional regulator [Bacillus wiedmannii]PDZ58488.1 XRE family transcriptional regulator [Bacillus cereus]PFI61002.1 XRE family transcriptional regulator [Bacillus cereus]PFJ84364.1 XRE family transcriptional regulator [Bacillus cereus]
MIGENLRKLRKKNNLTMKELGQKLNLAESTISGYENGNRKPDYETLNKFADFFEVSTDYLFGRDVTQKDINTCDPLFDPDLGLWFKDIKDASPETQEELKQFWEFIKTKEKNRKPGDKQ